MSAWLYGLSISWMAVWVFGVTFFLTWLIYIVVKRLATSERAKVAFSSISAGMLPPLGVVYGLFVTIIASQVWSDIEKANAAIYREANALSAVVFLTSSFPGNSETHIRNLIRRHIHEAITREWPMMAKHKRNIKVTSRSLAEALQFVLKLKPRSEGQTTAQRAIVNALENALDARRQRIVVSLSDVNWLTWMCLVLQAICTLLAIAMVHCNNRIASISAMSIFATGIAVSVLLIISHNRPFAGPLAINSDLLLQIELEEMLSQQESSQLIASRLTSLINAAKKVIDDYQNLINLPASDKNFTAEKVIEETVANYVKMTGKSLPDLDPNSLEGIILQAVLDSITDVINKAQPLINNSELAFKGFLPPIFAYQVAQSFNQKVGELAYLKLTAPQDLVIEKSNLPDEWENLVIKTKFLSSAWQKGNSFSEVSKLNGKKAFRIMIPEYYNASCLNGCHGLSKEDKNGIIIDSIKIGELGGALSVGIYLK